ncbi:hypothetical protein L1987_42720 [Smallanthus sonchifolius]|uniref:Uncharacterized protein n=1 Tax=Smallanthus sonchifolius TaxID=185202 RepID=A0ACB9GJN6_9ASTR|nr:hypothetical protein L1987_42720 [Smallanthus sonchifolius]
MKSNGLTLILVVLFSLVLVSSAGRTYHMTAQSQTQKPKGEAKVEGENVAHTDSTWGGCYGCWPNKKNRRL